MKAAPLILTLDIGSSSLRALVYDGGNAVEGLEHQVPYHLATSSEGEATLNADTLLEAAASAIDHVLNKAGNRAAQIAAVASDTLVSNVLGVDTDGRPLTPIFTYADTRNSPDAAALRAEYDGEAVHQRTGCMIHSSYLPARFAWLRRTQPDLLGRVERWVSFGEYLYWTFLGEWRASYSVASWTGLLNRHTLTWDSDWLSPLGLDPSRFSPLADVSETLHGLRQPWADRWPALKRVPWFPSAGDGATANVGSGCKSPGNVALTIGTSGAMRVVLEGKLAEVPKGLWSYRVNRHHSLLGGATTEGGNVYAWLRQTLQLPEPEVLEKELAAMEPSDHGLIFLPFLAGERAPGWRDDAHATLSGLALKSTPLEIARAGLEGVALRYALIHKLLAPHLPEQHQIIASGAALLASPVWMQIMADVLGRPVTASAEKEATSRGAAILALECLGIKPAPAALGATYEPDHVHHFKYQYAVEQQARLYGRMFSV